MKALLFLLLSSSYLFTHAQSWQQDISFWVGQGQDSAIFIVDFNDSSTFESYAWGILFDGNIDGAAMIQAIASADPGFQYADNNGFLNDIIYGTQQGLGGQPDFWSTWDGLDMGTLSTNLGLSTVIGPGALFACSYTDFNPATYPDTPVAAINPLAFTFADINIWLGNGADSTVLVIDFNDGQSVQSYAWGYLFDGNLLGEDLLTAIVAADPKLDVVISNGFLSDITYASQAGLGGQPDYWSTWNGTDMAHWSSNLGLSSAVQPGEFFGCSYTDFNPALPPSPPVPADLATSIARLDGQVTLYPNPVTDVLRIEASTPGNGSYAIFNLQGQLVQNGTWQGTTPLAVAHLPAGTYVIQLMHEEGRFQTTITKH